MCWGMGFIPGWAFCSLSERELVTRARTWYHQRDYRTAERKGFPPVLWPSSRSVGVGRFGLMNTGGGGERWVGVEGKLKFGTRWQTDVWDDATLMCRELSHLHLTSPSWLDFSFWVWRSHLKSINTRVLVMPSPLVTGASSAGCGSFSCAPPLTGDSSYCDHSIARYNNFFK